ncbi:GmrSD restriction endonuclease domain-containing protein [Mycolicibacter acidiphilus]|uniref:GmrSD restriction endonuclease domain-containing protein n=1 Tax=Mycolicibacter acidiphilus TaxID=2835306 RepID=UPI003556097F
MAAALTAAAVVTGAPAPAEPVPGAPVDVQAELAKLDTLPIKGRAPKTGYNRGLFGPAWSDDVTVPGGHNGCDTRNDVLRRDLTDIEFKPGTNDCVVLSGVLNDPYTGTAIDFQRGRGTSRAVQIDHIVALSDAWQKGAQQWDDATRANFANDPLNLQATSGPVNEQKGDGDAATWLPPNKAYRPEYVARIVEVKATYGLWVTQAEHDAIARILTSGQPADEPAPPPQDAPAPFAAAAAPDDAYFPNCAAARAAGVAPLHTGEPGYRPGLDRDGDGIACE